MITIRLVLMILALVCLAMSAMGISAPKANIQSLGLALWLLAVMIS